MDRLSRLFKSKIMVFVIQIAILSLFIFIFNYKSLITIDAEISPEIQVIIQFLANYVIFTIEENGIIGFFVMFFSWTFIGLIPIFLFQNYKKAWKMNLITFFFPNFFFYVFYARYPLTDPNSYMPDFSRIPLSIFLQTILIGLYLVSISIGLSLLLKKLKKQEGDVQIEDLREIAAISKSKCPHCGTEFKSIPKYCYNCSKEIITDSSEKK